MKITRNQKQVVDSLGNFNHYSSIRDSIDLKRSILFDAILEENGGEIINSTSSSELNKTFSFTGAFKVSDLNHLRFPDNDFIRKNPARYFVKSDKEIKEFHLRGPRYIVALDPKYSVQEKLDILFDDIEECSFYIDQFILNGNEKNSSVCLILDYLKNALVTLFNAFIHKEKYGIIQSKKSDYQLNRDILQETLGSAVYLYYLSLLAHIKTDDLVEFTELLCLKNIKFIRDHILKDFKENTFSVQSIKRPESTHPLVIYSAAFDVARMNPNCDVMFGIPCGSTELAALAHMLIKKRSNPNCRLSLIPISLYPNSNNTLPVTHIDYDLLYQLFPITDKAKPVEVVLIDDNSATGQTLQKLNGMVSEHYKCNLKSYIAEADLERIAEALGSDNNNCSIADYDLLSTAINILPVSRLTNPGSDLKDLQERILLSRFYLKRPTNNMTERIMNEAISDVILYRHFDISKGLNGTNSIQGFKDLFLSNLYRVKLKYRGDLYYSVEHAFLSQKLKVIYNLNKSAQFREALSMSEFSSKSEGLKSGNNFLFLSIETLRKLVITIDQSGYYEKEWKEKRLLVMSEILMIKFNEEDLKTKLIETTDRYLVELGDSFWGISQEDLGFNFLGRLLMIIRDKLRR